MNEQSVLDLIKAGGVPYDSVRGKIKSGDLLALHHDFVASWYGVQIEAVQRFTGPFAHVAMFQWVNWGGVDRLGVCESVVPKRRFVAVSATAEEGFFWLPMNREPSAEEHRAVADSMGFGEYDKLGAIEAGLDKLPADEDANPRMWCAKAVNLWRRVSGVDLGSRYVPTDMVLTAILKYNARLQYVRMNP